MASSAQEGTAGPSRPEVKDGDLLPDQLPRATSIIVIGMAGSGKSTFTSCLQNYHADQQKGESAKEGDASTTTEPAPYFVNLDPAVTQLNYSPNVDIRDTIDYQRLMEEYNLGPNGGILTALNLFTTKFDQVLGILERRSNDVDHIILDTPGQIEIFTWSASGSIITDALATAMPTVVAYIIDTPRTLAPATFMSNMLYACSIMYKTKLPFIIVFNKTDVQDHQFAMEWMDDFEKFQHALKETRNPTEPIDPKHGGASVRRGDGDEGTYMNSLMNSMALILDEFYKNLRSVGVSSTTQAGMADFFDAVKEARKEYVDDYRPELDRIVKERAEKKEKDKKSQLNKMMKDMRLNKGKKSAGQADEEEEAEAALQENLDPEYEGDGQIIDPDVDEDIQDAQEDMFPSAGAQFGKDGSAWPRQFGQIDM
ncbi:uncharacterized protein FA14DRAFT_160615 [Meira miltonrushii]|uniref:GPN-loop GTPase n=1 Tax=Meira miltonrushii TaxID=1280837 RepID=A0A316VD63_9BASI|nr:uncharacterized protein FA14DRAFT_160615 [Meira miltonrushii]PWN35486.1 hypothetical protein FA14DRAFT_160615 [Meira miltonrushii]